MVDNSDDVEDEDDIIAMIETNPNHEKKVYFCLQFLIMDGKKSFQEHKIHFWSFSPSVPH